VVHDGTSKEDLMRWHSLRIIALITALLLAGNTLAHAQAFDFRLQERGFRLKTAGRVMMSVGAAMTLVGMVVFAHGHSVANLDRPICDAGRAPDLCIINSEASAGASILGLGLVSFFAGIPVYAVGVHQINTARRYRPQFSATGVGLSF
jgi:hypothetical protein